MVARDSSTKKKIGLASSRFSPQLRRFHFLLGEIASKLELYGIYRSAYSSNPVFLDLEPDVRQRIVTSLEREVRVLKSLSSAQTDMDFDRKFIWRSMLDMNILPHKDFWKYYNKNCVVEFYNSHGIQLFRNFNFYHFCSYTIEDVYTRTLFDLYERDKKINDLITHRSLPFFLRDVKTSVNPEIPDHCLVEKNSDKENKIRMRINRLVPLKLRNHPDIILAVIEECKILSSKKNSNSKKSSGNKNNANKRKVYEVPSIH